MTTRQTITMAALMGVLFLAFEREWIIVRFPSWRHEPVHKQGAEKRSTALFFWNHDRWVQETVEVIWVEKDTGQTIKYLMDRWLTWLDEERLTDRKIALQTVLLTPHEQEAFVSFDRSPFTLEASI
jgi:hypothetical protein